MLKYTKDRVIDIDEPSSEEDWTDSTSEEEEEQLDGPKDKNPRYSEEIQHAVGYSIIKRMGIKTEVKKEILKKYQKVYFEKKLQHNVKDKM